MDEYIQLNTKITIRMIFELEQKKGFKFNKLNFTAKK